MGFYSASGGDNYLKHTNGMQLEHLLTAVRACANGAGLPASRLVTNPGQRRKTLK
jgi:hypothetical protein